MKCERCGAWTEVAETRQADGGHTLRRTRVCGNGHRFATFEVVAPIYRRDPRAVVRAMRAIADRIKLWQRDSAAAAIIKAGKTHAEAAAELGLSRQVVTKAMARLATAARRVTPGRRTSGSPGRAPPR